ncbi:MAG: glycosyl hydrolase family 8 [Flavobacteriaceae bacterium]
MNGLLKGIFILLMSLVCNSIVLGQNNPYPNHTVYTANHIKPTNYTQVNLDNQTSYFYNLWKAEYLKNDCGNTDEYYIKIDPNRKTVSEAHGYGMMITAYFAGFDANAKLYFDGLYNYYKSNPSIVNAALMDWEQVTCNDAVSSSDGSASDGDIDIAFALLLAHQQWGSAGVIDYLSEANAVMIAIMQHEINQQTFTVTLGDWVNSSNPNYYYSTRASDFMMDHFKTFSCFTNNSNWDNVVNNTYNLVTTIQDNYSANTGLLPDFIINLNGTPSPAGGNFLEGPNDGRYYYNSCRVPWRLGVDYLTSGDSRPQIAVNKINTWLKNDCNSNVWNISNGYHLNGTDIFNWSDATFVAPFVVAAMLNTTEQAWLNTMYSHLLTNNGFSYNYYADTIKLLSMVAISGNYWIPTCPNSAGIEDANSLENKVNLYPNTTNGIAFIDFSEKFRNNNKIIFITDVNGRQLLKQTTQLNKYEVDLSSYESGLYFVSIKIENEITISKKIIKK